ncbi:alpha/beta hydrolase [Pedobacter miscanthi]|uniref:Alpha/beta hydrolase n=1 Tax=Pedobacter miscanthi TaxID=2259170 RepID=A0A366LFG7_9SPHI|nr:alpha/beta hydrolase [Pedobacter miscanthi]RBQ11882.1 alpha/beta hydrolase [Pedobacter miscanthi]
MKWHYLIFLLCCSVIVKAQQEFNLYSGKIPNSKGCEVKEIWTEEKGKRGTVKKVTVPTLKVFMPQNTGINRPAVIICPGGGYGNLSIFDGGYETAAELSKAGIVAFVLKYRLSDSLCNKNNGLIALQDAQQAISLVRKNAAKYGVNPNKIGYVGFSAGGHLAAMASTHYNDKQVDSDISLRPDFTILAYPIISFRDSLTAPGSKTRINLLGKNITQEQIRWYSPELNVNNQTPPAFLIHASDDQTALVENSLSYYEALHKRNIPATIKIYQKGGHGFANYNKAEDDHWLPQAVKWLKMNNFLN